MNHFYFELQSQTTDKLAWKQENVGPMNRMQKNHESQQDGQRGERPLEVGYQHGTTEQNEVTSKVKQNEEQFKESFIMYFALQLS